MHVNTPHHTHTTPRHFTISAITSHITSHITSQVPKVIADEGRAVATVWAGELMGKAALPPPPRPGAAAWPPRGGRRAAAANVMPPTMVP